jgi:hypothetical protein
VCAQWTSGTPGLQVSSEQNPGPVLFKNGSMTMFYRASAGLPEPTCSTESIGVQYCASRNATCAGGFNPVFNHTAEDPSVFRDTRGNWHMLVNALPGGCNPKLQQGGHAWSRDGVVWSEPRMGAYNGSIALTDGSTMTCNRRERPQMILDPSTGAPLAMTSGVTQCVTAVPPLSPGPCGRPARVLVPESKLTPRSRRGNRRCSPSFGPYKGGNDCFTLVQLMAS